MKGVLSVTDKLANSLYVSGCLKFGNFQIKSGANSPYYIDLARLLALPEELCSVADIAARTVSQLIVSDGVDKLASIELKGALIVPSIACRVNLPCVVVRKEEKGYGVKGRIAGADVAKGDNILFFDDVVSEGLPKIEGIRPLEELGATVKHLLVVVDRQQGGREHLEKLGYKVHSLAKISEVVDSLCQSRLISEVQAQEVLEYIKSFRGLSDTT